MALHCGSQSYPRPPVRQRLDRLALVATGRSPAAQDRAMRALTAAHLARRPSRCPCCGGRFERFLPYRNRDFCRCPRCDSHERHRALWLYLRDRADLAGTLLHLAPEAAIARHLRDRAGVDYVSANLDSPLAMLALRHPGHPLPRRHLRRRALRARADRGPRRPQGDARDGPRAAPWRLGHRDGAVGRAERRPTRTRPSPTPRRAAPPSSSRTTSASTAPTSPTGCARPASPSRSIPIPRQLGDDAIRRYGLAGGRDLRAPARLSGAARAPFRRVAGA